MTDLSHLTLTRIRTRSHTNFTHEATSPEPDLHKLLAHISIYERSVQYEYELARQQRENQQQQQQQRRRSSSPTGSESSDSDSDSGSLCEGASTATVTATVASPGRPGLQRAEYVDPAAFVAGRNAERTVTVSTQAIGVVDDEVEEWE